MTDTVGAIVAVQRLIGLHSQIRDGLSLVFGAWQIGGVIAARERDGERPVSAEDVGAAGDVAPARDAVVRCSGIGRSGRCSDHRSRPERD